VAPGTGRLIAFEGGEAAGKSTQAKRLAAGIDGELTREPGGTAVGERLRELLLKTQEATLSARAELFLMLAARAEHVAEKIGPALLEGRHVVVDRFTASSIAYQGYGRQLPLREVEAACGFATGGLEPDLYVLLDLPVALTAVRRPGKGHDRIERAGPEFHERVRQGFLAQAAREPERWCVVDAAQPVEAVFSAVAAAVSSRLGLQVTGTAP
jgi:dTMP kinase